MSLVNKIKPAFWDHHETVPSDQRPMSFRSKWLLIVFATSVVALTPLIIMTYIDFRLTRGTIESEVRESTTRVVANTWRTVSIFLAQRKSALQFIAQDNSFQSLKRPERLEELLNHLETKIGGFTDIGLLDAKGNMVAYSGPYHLAGTDFSHDECFQKVVTNGGHIRGVTGDEPSSRHLVVAVKHELGDESFFVIRSTLDTDLLNRLLSNLEAGKKDDAFIISTEGILQTPSRFHGRLHEPVPLPLPEYKPGANLMDGTDIGGDPAYIGYAYIPDSSLILMVVRPRSEITALWFKPRLKLVGFLVLSIALILIAILGTATFLVSKIHAADQERVSALHHVEYANKLASLGRLASGVAHEINNPLAIINQKAGLIKDLFALTDRYGSDAKLMELIDSVIRSVERAGSITRRLLNFSRHMETRTETFDLLEMIREILGFFKKDADYRKIGIHIDSKQTRLPIESDRGNLQQIFLNIFNNAFTAMGEGGSLDIFLKKVAPEKVVVTIADDGCGITPENLHRIFEPFFSNRSGRGETGLGLSITYGLVQKLGGDISVESTVGVGTRFNITLPVSYRGDRDVDGVGTDSDTAPLEKA